MIDIKEIEKDTSNPGNCLEACKWGKKSINQSVFIYRAPFIQWNIAQSALHVKSRESKHNNKI